ncbi:hypothetical protein C0J52_20710, partial [Blattella germanica]
FTTEDKLEYQFNPVTSGALHFKVRAAHDAHVALTPGPAEGEPMYEIFIGGWDNGKCAIRRDRQKPDKAIADTPDVLSDAEYRGFWIRWAGGSVAVGREGEVAPFLAWDDPEPFGIGYYGICTGWGATGSWLVEGGAEITTADNLQYSYRPIPVGSIHVEVRAPSDGHIALTSAKQETEPMYEILLGGWENSATVIRYDRKKPDKVRVDTPNLLTNNNYTRFLVEWQHGHLTVKKADGTILIDWKDPNPFGISHYGVRTAWGARGQWKVRPQDPRAPAPASQPGWQLPSAPPSGGAACWVDAQGGEVPSGAVPGGFDNEQVYVGRASHEGALIPGKVVPSHGVCYVPWGGQEHGKTEYQVLTGCEAAWIPAAGGALPEGALPSGESEDGEPLFVGRAAHEGTMTVGKVRVKTSHTTCFFTALIEYSQGYSLLL